MTELLSLPLAAEHLGVSVRTLHRLLRAGMIMSVSIGRRRLNRREAVNRFVAEREAVVRA